MEPKKWMTSDEVVREWGQAHPEVMLAFSGGKDSVAAWLQMRPHFKRIVPVYQYLIPDLEFIEQGLRYYEEWFKTPIIRVPHASLYRLLTNWVFQSPETSRAHVLSWLGLPKLSNDLLRQGVAKDMGWDVDNSWIAVGTRSCDSPIRKMAFDKWGPVKENGKTFYPVWDWNKARVVETIREAGVRLPQEYRVFGRSFDGIDFRFLYGIRKNWPRDYARILKWFPLAEVELKRYEFKLKRGEIRV